MPNLEDEKEFYEAIGRAITEWSSVEAELYQIFHAALGDADKRAASSAFYAALSFQVKLGMTTDAIGARLNIERVSEKSFKYKKHKFMDVWKILHRKMDKASKTRNLLAHLIAVISHENGLTTYKLRQNARNPKYAFTWIDDNNSFDTNKLGAARRHFWALRNELVNIRPVLIEALKPPV